LYSRLPSLVNRNGRQARDGDPKEDTGCSHSAGLTPCLSIGKHKIYRQPLSDGR
jgi:hypothetical protein